MAALCCSCDSKTRSEETGYTFTEGYSSEVTPEVDAGLPGKIARTAPVIPAAAPAPKPPAAPAAEVVQEAAKEPASAEPPKASPPPAAAPLPNLPRGKIAQQDYRKCWEDHTFCFVYGTLTGSNTPGIERELEWYGALTDAEMKRLAYTCRKGHKGAVDNTPNQDNFSMAHFKNGWRMLCCMDGHGPFGQLVATTAVQSLPYLVALSNFEAADITKVLTHAFEEVHFNVEATAQVDQWSTETSGCTAVATLWKGNQVYIAHVGDSRCVIGSKSQILHESADHKPSNAVEKQRIEENGGEIHTEVYPDGWTEHRIFVKGTDKPGLSMSRSIGDQIVKPIGVMPTPEVRKLEIRKEDEPFMVLASDGVWEFLTSETVVKAATSTLRGRGVEQTVQDLYEAAKQCWHNAESDYCDDITAILVEFE